MHKMYRVVATALGTAALVVLPACGDDDSDSAASTTEETSTSESSETTTSDSSTDGSGSRDTGDDEFPNEEFCEGVADLENAQDGAQRNEAIQKMVDAAPSPPFEIARSIDMLNQGDLPAETYAAAEEALSAVCD